MLFYNGRSREEQRMNKRLISLVLTFIMLITMVPSTIVEASEVTTMESVKASSNQSEVTKPEENTIYAVNPLYEDVISIDDLKKNLTPKAQIRSLQMASSSLGHSQDSIFRIMTVPFYISESRWLAEKRK